MFSFKVKVKVKVIFIRLPREKSGLVKGAMLLI